MALKNLSENPAVCKLKEFGKSLSNVRIKKDYDMTVSVYNAEEPEKDISSHNVKGSSDESLLKMMAVVGIVSVFVSAVCCVCSLLKSDK